MPTTYSKKVINGKRLLKHTWDIWSLVMPFGLCNTPTLFQTLVTVLFQRSPEDDKHHHHQLFSEQLNPPLPPARNYDVSDWELLAIKYSLEE